MDLQIIPPDIYPVIYEFIGIKAKVYLTKKNFVRYYGSVWDDTYRSSRSRMQSHIIDIIRKERRLPFGILIDKYADVWSDHYATVWRCSDTKLRFPNYLSFINYLCMRYEKQRLRELLTEKIRQNSKSSQKNRHKKIRTRNISWSS